jgi:uncharacterized protein
MSAQNNRPRHRPLQNRLASVSSAKIILASLALVAVGCAPAATQTAVTRQALTIDLGDFQTKAELSLPASSGGALPTVILIHGSGPEDMDATIFGTGADGKPVKLSSIFKDIADAGAAQGLAVLRYNKHYVSGPNQFDAQPFYTKLDLNQMLKDAKKVLEVAKANPRVDAKRIYVYGWSEGSTVAAALTVAHPEVAGLIVQGPVALTWRETLLFQVLEVGLPHLRSFATDGRVTNATLQRVLSAPGGMVAKSILNYIGDPIAFRAGRIEINPLLDTNKNAALDLETELTPQVFGSILDAGFASFFSIYAPGRALSTLLETAGKLKLPVLVLQGANDANVPERGARALETALKTAGNADVTLKVYAGLGHSLGLASSLSDDDFRPMAGAPLTDLLDWLRERTKR